MRACPIAARKVVVNDSSAGCGGRGTGGGRGSGRAVQVAPIKPTLKAPGTKRLRLNFDTLL
jgi:hypothetical protein